MRERLAKAREEVAVWLEFTTDVSSSKAKGFVWMISISMMKKKGNENSLGGIAQKSR